MNLLHDDLLVEIVIHVMPDRSSRAFVSKGRGDQMARTVVEAMLTGAIRLARQWGVTINGDAVKALAEKG